jgi:tetratricopeptide (TPR) repeat protein
LWDFAQGYAHLKQGSADFAQLYLARVRKAAETSTARFRVHTAKDLLTIAAGILEGEMQRMAGDLDGAIVSFQRAADVQDALVYDEPEPLPFAAHHWLGAALLESGRFDEAETVYRADLKEHPRNGWSLLGLQQALAGRGAPSAEVTADLAAAWARADTWIRSSRF